MIICIYKALLFFWLTILVYACHTNVSKEKQPQQQEKIANTNHRNIEEADTINVNVTSTEEMKTKSQSALALDSLGFVDISALDSTIQIHLIYTQADNFTGQVLYDDLKEAYLHPDAAHALVHAHQLLKEIAPSYHFIVYDAARPMSAQRKMWNAVKGTSQYMYVSNPAHGGGLHNYGLAVDISLADSLGNPLSMGTRVDHLGVEAHITQENELVRSGKISEQEHKNRLLLRQVMREAGFRALPSEWWHFNLCSRETAKRKYKPIP